LSYDQIPTEAKISFPLQALLPKVGSIVMLGMVTQAVSETLILDGGEKDFASLLVDLRLNALTLSDVGSFNSTVDLFRPVSLMNEYRALRSGLLLFHDMLKHMPSLEVCRTCRACHPYIHHIHLCVGGWVGV
jgi:hypothetical protein